MQDVRTLSWPALLCAGVLVLASTAAAPKKPQAPPVLRPTNYLGYGDSLILTGSALRAVIVPSAGGRILEYSINGENVLLERAGAALPADAGEFAAGYQCAIGPRLPGLAPPFWTGPYEAAAFTDFGVKLASALDPQSGIQVQTEILMEPESGDLGITQRLRNPSKKEATRFLWDRTSCKGGGFAFFPLKKKSQFPAQWSLLKAGGDKPTYESKNPKSPQVRVINGVLVARCEGETTTLGADSDAGWIAYVRGKWLLIKYFPYNAKGRYESGHSVRVAFNEQAVQLSLLSPEIKLAPGESSEFPEKWTLLELDGNVSSFEEARALVKRIPPSPF